MRRKTSQLILLATPVYAILDWMEQLAPALSPEQLVTDVGSTKAIITATGNRLFNQPGRAAFLPGHPMAGKEVGGAAEADATLFRGAVWIFTTDPWISQQKNGDIAPECRPAWHGLDANGFAASAAASWRSTPRVTMN